MNAGQRRGKSTPLYRRRYHYIDLVEKKKILNIKTIGNENLVIQSLINRIIAFLIVIMFLGFNISNYKDLLQSGDEERINNQKIRILVSTFALLSVTTEIYLTIKEFISLKEQES